MQKWSVFVKISVTRMILLNVGRKSSGPPTHVDIMSSGQTIEGDHFE